MSTINVSVRFRPQNQVEKSESSVDVVTVNPPNGVSIPSAALDFTFDKVFGTDSTQEQVFELTGKPLIQEIFRGYNCTVFVYGQTGSGKSHTMMGKIDQAEPELAGITPRLVECLFDAIEKSPSNLEFTVKVSYIEIYLERLRDLLNPVADNLNIREGQKGVWIEGCTEVYVSGVNHVLKLIDQGANSRAIASTRMNMESSRSHSVFMLILGKTDLDTGSKTTSTLFLVDLAGSEKISKTGAAGQTLKEAQHINKSLSALGNVINALTENKVHIPYRDSKLTRLLCDALGGNAKTSLIVTASCMSYNLEETISTLRFGQRAKTIKNKAVINSERSVQEYKILLERAVSEKDSLQRKVEELTMTISQLKSSTGSEDSKTAYTKEIESSVVEEMKVKLLETEEELSVWRVRCEKLENEFVAINEQLDNLASDIGISSAAFEAEREKTDQLHAQLDSSEQATVLLKSRYTELEALNKKLQYQYNESSNECVALKARIPRIDELEASNAELQRVLGKKIEQNMDLCMQLDDSKYEIASYRAATASNDPVEMAKVFGTYEVIRLKRVVEKMTREQESLQLDMSQAISELRVKMQIDIDAKEKMAKNHQVIMDELLMVLQDNSRIYKESADRDAQRITDLENQLNMYKKFYDSYNAPQSQTFNFSGRDRAASAFARASSNTSEFEPHVRRTSFSESHGKIVNPIRTRTISVTSEKLRADEDTFANDSDIETLDK